MERYTPGYLTGIKYLLTAPRMQTISRLPLQNAVYPPTTPWGSRVIGGVYFRYFQGYRGSREIFGDERKIFA